MNVRFTNAIPLAPRSTLKHYSKDARNLVDACSSDDFADVRHWAGELIERLGRQAHLSATPEYVTKRSRRPDRKQINNEVEDILRDVREMRLVGRPRKGKIPLSRARLFLARLHGFETWSKFAKHLELCRKRASPVWQFESAVDAIVTGDAAGLARLLRKYPSLLRARSTRAHRATLLHYIAANGHEGYRQRSPRNAVKIARILLEAGAEPDALANMYGHRVTTMQMLVSSTPPHDAGVQVPLVETLLDFGAAPNGPDDAGSPLMTAFRFHFPAAAEALARRGARVDNIISASALGRTDLVDRFVGDRGTLRAGSPPPRGPWPKLSKDPKEHLGYALTWACTFGRTEVVELLLRKGVDPSGQDDDASALHFAAAYGRIDLVRLLLRHGASLEMLNSYGGTVLSGTLWYAFNAPIKDVNYATVVRELIALGARTDLYPALETHIQAVLDGKRGGGYAPSKSTDSSSIAPTN